MRNIFHGLLIVVLLLPLPALSQQKTIKPVTSLALRVDSFALGNPSEKVFVHIDRPYYTNTDTIWLKAYVLDGTLSFSRQSGLLYTELVNDTGRVVLRQCLPLREGLSWGQLTLDTLQVPEGGYTLRAYTNWMQNIGEACFFTRQLYIGRADEASWRVKAGHKLNGQDMEMALQLLENDGSPARLKEMELRLMQDGKTRLRDKLQTDLDGRMRFNFKLPGQGDGQGLTVVAQDRNGRKLVVPVPLNRPQNADVQFMPEGGQLVAGLTCRTGFKAVGEDGLGLDISGTVYDSKNNAVVAFKSTHLGMGAFMFTPQAGEVYTAGVTLPDGTVKSYALPRVNPQGLVLTLNNIPGRDSLLLAVQASGVFKNDRYTLIAQNGGGVYYASAVMFKNGDNTVYGKIPKSGLPAGVVRFTLFTGSMQPLAERLVFINHHDALHINISPAKETYSPGDSVLLNISVTDQYHRPVQGSFSLAVTDDSQVKADSSNVQDIYSYMLLGSNLKGHIEQPGYYCTPGNIEAEQQLDNLLLTQGWVGYSRDKVFDDQYTPEYRAEKGPAVTGVVKRLSKPQPGLRVSLLSTKGGDMLFRDTVSNEAGRFVFDSLPLADTPAYMVQVKDKKGKVFESYIQVDEFKPAGTKSLPRVTINPWYVNTDTTLMNFNRQNLAYQKQLEDMQYPNSGKVLQEVVIKAKKVVQGSYNLNGPGNADQVLDEEDLIKLDKMSLINLLNKYIKGFGIRTKFVRNCNHCSKAIRSYYGVYEKQVKLVIDGVQVDFLLQPNDVLTENSYLNYINQTIELLTAEDIKGIEVLYNRNLTAKYVSKYDPQLFVTQRCYTCVPPAYADPIYIEITTWSGNGLFQHRKNGMALYRPIPIIWPIKFYKPQYPIAANTLYNLRPTLYWEPNIITDTSGCAQVSFYTKNKKSTYTVILQGSNLTGQNGVAGSKIKTDQANQ